MKNLMNFLIRPICYFSILTVCFYGCAISYSAPVTISASGDHCLSPYFKISNEREGTEHLPLKSTQALVRIAGVIADVKITQIYKNEGNLPIEAVYIFPASTHAAVYKMKMMVGTRVIQAMIRERDQARKDYEQARLEGQSASLLEELRPNIFQMNVANILPGDIIQVELQYTELLQPEKGVYTFVYPAVVGPRYSGKTEATEKWISNPYTGEGEKPPYSFDIKVQLNTAIPLKDLSCDTHPTDISYQGTSAATVCLQQGNTTGGNKDFILKYRLQGENIQSGVLLYEGENENYFLAMVQPPQRILPKMIPPREYVFILDVSGSMHGFPIEISKQLMRNLLSHLKPSDKFNLILFAGCSNLLCDSSLAVNEDNINRAMELIDRQEGGGGTELLPALKCALNLKGVKGYARSFVIATDGYVDIEKESFDLIRRNLGEASFFTFGIGTSVNRYLLEGMASVGRGEPFIIEQAESANQMAETFREYIQSPLLTHIQINFPGFEVYDAEPLSIPSLYADRPLLIYGKYRGKPSGTIQILGVSGERKYKQSFDMTSIPPSQENSALRYLWARNRIMLLDDYGRLNENDEENRKQVTELGLKYNLLTAYTSFLAIDSEIRNKDGQQIRVEQPLPLPEGVSNLARGGEIQRKVFSTNYTPGVYKASSLSVKEDEIQDVAEPVSDNELVEVHASFQGGDLKKFKNWLFQQIRNPRDTKGVLISGVVNFSFVINERGGLVDIQILNSSDPLLTKELFRILRKAPLWKSASQGGLPIPETYTLVVNFPFKS